MFVLKFAYIYHVRIENGDLTIITTLFSLEWLHNFLIVFIKIASVKETTHVRIESNEASAIL